MVTSKSMAEPSDTTAVDDAMTSQQDAEEHQQQEEEEDKEEEEANEEDEMEQMKAMRRKMLAGDVTTLPPVGRSIVRIYLCCAVGDFSAERNYLSKTVFPSLRHQCRQQHALDLQVVDLKWDEMVQDDHESLQLYLEQIKLAQALSLGPNFLLMLGQKRGRRHLPARMSSQAYERLMDHVRDNQEDTELLAEWFVKDTNCEPPVYVLQHVSTKLDNTEHWWPVRDRIQAILLAASHKTPVAEDSAQLHAADAARFSLDEEINQGILSIDIDEDTPATVAVYVRTIADLHDIVTSAPEDSAPATYSRYIDFTPDGKIDEDAQKFLDELKQQTIPEKLLGQSIRYYEPTLADVEATPTSDDSPVAVDEQDSPDTEQQLPPHYLEDLGKDVLADLNQIIEDAVEARPIYGELIFEVLSHTRYCVDNMENFCGPDAILEAVKSKILDPATIETLVIFAPSGLGKTALSAKIVDLYPSWVNDNEAVRVFRFIGTTPRSSNVLHLLESLVKQMVENELFDAVDCNESRVDIRYQSLLKSFHEGVHKIKRNVLILLDGLEQLSIENESHLLNWLPPTLPHSVRMVVSVSSEKTGELCLSSARRKVTNAENFIEIPPLTEQDINRFVEQAKALYGRQLTDEQSAMLLACCKECPTPVFVKIVTHWAVQWTSYDKTMLDDTWLVEKTLEGAIGKVFSDLELKHGQVVTTQAMSYLTASRGGLTDGEMEDLLSLDDDVMNAVYSSLDKPPDESFLRIPGTIWPRLYHDLRDFFSIATCYGSSLMTWRWQKLKEIASKKYVVTKSAASEDDTNPDDANEDENSTEPSNDKQNDTKLFENLADYFKGSWHGKPKPLTLHMKGPSDSGDSQATDMQLDNVDRQVPDQPLMFANGTHNHRKLHELPFHLMKAQDKTSELFDLVLCNAEWIGIKCKATSLKDVIQDYEEFLVCNDDNVGIRHIFNTLTVISLSVEPTPDVVVELCDKLLNYSSVYRDTIGKLITSAKNVLEISPATQLVPISSLAGSPGRHEDSSAPTSCTINTLQASVSETEAYIYCGCRKELITVDAARGIHVRNMSTGRYTTISTFDSNSLSVDKATLQNCRSDVALVASEEMCVLRLTSKIPPHKASLYFFDCATLELIRTIEGKSLLLSNDGTFVVDIEDSCFVVYNLQNGTRKLTEKQDFSPDALLAWNSSDCVSGLSGNSNSNNNNMTVLGYNKIHPAGCCIVKVTDGSADENDSSSQASQTLVLLDLNEVKVVQTFKCDTEHNNDTTYYLAKFNKLAVLSHCKPDENIGSVLMTNFIQLINLSSHNEMENGPSMNISEQMQSDQGEGCYVTVCDRYICIQHGLSTVKIYNAGLLELLGTIESINPNSTRLIMCGCEDHYMFLYNYDSVVMYDMSQYSAVTQWNCNSAVHTSWACLSEDRKSVSYFQQNAAALSVWNITLANLPQPFIVENDRTLSDKVSMSLHSTAAVALRTTGEFTFCNFNDDDEQPVYKILEHAPKLNADEPKFQQTSVALSEDGDIAAIAGKSLELMDTRTGEIFWTPTEDPKPAKNTKRITDNNFYVFKPRYRLISWSRGKWRQLVAIEMVVNGNDICRCQLHVIQVDVDALVVVRWDKFPFTPHLDYKLDIAESSVQHCHDMVTYFGVPDGEQQAGNLQHEEELCEIEQQTRQLQQRAQERLISLCDGTEAFAKVISQSTKTESFTLYAINTLQDDMEPISVIDVPNTKQGRICLNDNGSQVAVLYFDTAPPSDEGEATKSSPPHLCTDLRMDIFPVEPNAQLLRSVSITVYHLSPPCSIRKFYFNSDRVVIVINSLLYTFQLPPANSDADAGHVISKPVWGGTGGFVAILDSCLSAFNVVAEGRYFVGKAYLHAQQTTDIVVVDVCKSRLISRLQMPGHVLEIGPVLCTRDLHHAVYCHRNSARIGVLKANETLLDMLKSNASNKPTSNDESNAEEEVQDEKVKPTLSEWDESVINKLMELASVTEETVDEFQLKDWLASAPNFMKHMCFNLDRLEVQCELARISVTKDWLRVSKLLKDKEQQDSRIPLPPEGHVFIPPLPPPSEPEPEPEPESSSPIEQQAEESEVHTTTEKVTEEEEERLSAIDEEQVTRTEDKEQVEQHNEETIEREKTAVVFGPKNKDEVESEKPLEREKTEEVFYGPKNKDEVENPPDPEPEREPKPEPKPKASPAPEPVKTQQKPAEDKKKTASPVPVEKPKSASRRPSSTRTETPPVTSAREPARSNGTTPTSVIIDKIHTTSRSCTIS